MIRRLLFTLALCLAFTAPALAQGKIGIASLVNLSTQSEPGKEIERVLQSSFGAERGELEKMAADLNKQAAELNTQAAALSESARTQRAQTLQQRAQEMDAKSAAYSARLNEVQRAISLQMEDVLGAACIEYGRKNGFDLIVDDAAVLFAHEALDVTPGVMDEVNRLWQARGAKYDIPAPAAAPATGN